MSNSSLSDINRVEKVRDAVPSGGLFDAKTWRISPYAFPLDAKQVDFLEKLGQKLLAFQTACNRLYRMSAEGKAPAWIAQLLDAGKPEELIRISRESFQKNDLPKVIRPDLILTETGWAISEIDSVPGGLGLTSWLNQTYAEIDEPVIGGRDEMKQAVRNLLPNGSVVISEEASTYRPEFEWLFGEDRVKAAETYEFGTEPVYRFFEAFDWMGLENLRRTWHPEVAMTPPLKPYLEEKMWLALLWIKPLHEFWRRELSEKNFRELLTLVPQSWVVDPTPLPPTAVYPGIEAQSWDEVKKFSQKQRDLILKISGFSPLAWGARGVTLGSDVNEAEWASALDEALNHFHRSPYILQRFHKGKVVEHPVATDSGEIVPMQGRCRVCPYYIVEDGRAKLKGVLVTMCPANKKLLHGMKDAILLPAKYATLSQGHS